jgi:RNA polymerase-associated protein RTF1
MKMLEKRRALQSETMSGAALTLEKSRLTQARMLAARRQDWDEVSQIDAQLEALGGTVTGGTARRVEEDDAGVRMAKVNERNRKANLEAVRRMELAEAERKRLRRKLESSRTATPDPNASVKSEVPSRTATPSNGETKPLTATGPPPSAVSGTQSRVKETFDDTIVDEIDIDLGDF